NNLPNVTRQNVQRRLVLTRCGDIFDKHMVLLESSGKGLSGWLAKTESGAEAPPKQHLVKRLCATPGLP
ncbi:hypothetical protein, partial [Deinococcus multiflagellatus]|uniref:hypothetical protein n=1 Tax=Deinococcus multiflagellatus TaxID=1656887 RepID=UPI001CCAA618